MAPVQPMTVVSKRAALSPLGDLYSSSFVNWNETFSIKSAKWFACIEQASCQRLSSAQHRINFLTLVKKAYCCSNHSSNDPNYHYLYYCYNDRQANKMLVYFLFSFRTYQVAAIAFCCQSDGMTYSKGNS